MHVITVISGISRKIKDGVHSVKCVTQTSRDKISARRASSRLAAATAKLRPKQPKQSPRLFSALLGASRGAARRFSAVRRVWASSLGAGWALATRWLCRARRSTANARAWPSRVRRGPIGGRQAEQAARAAGRICALGRRRDGRVACRTLGACDAASGRRRRRARDRERNGRKLGGYELNFPVLK